MRIVEEQDAAGEIRRRVIVTTTADRRRDKAIRATLRRAKIGIDVDLYARVWEACRRVDDPETVALVYQRELARVSLLRAYERRPDALARAARQIGQVAKSLAGGAGEPMLSLPAPEGE